MTAQHLGIAYIVAMRERLSDINKAFSGATAIDYAVGEALQLEWQAQALRKLAQKLSAEQAVVQQR